ncbi:MAG: hypothetical protein P4L31_06700, partial [Candidatus Babeliales bacterium]|nr:hypothetical protein [Candidatus Babeliales bacterium]
MNINKKTFFCIFLSLVSTQSMQADCGQSCSNPKTIFIPRSQSVNAARDLSGEQQYINLPNKHNGNDYCADDVIKEIYGCFATTFEYTRSFRPNLLSNYLFGPIAQNGTVTFSGSTVANRGANDILADYFGLPQDFQSTVHFTPRISNYIVDFDLYCGLENAFFRVHAPLVHTMWALNPKECIINEGVLPFPASYMAQEAVPRSELPLNAVTAMAGGVTFGDMHTPLAYGKIAPNGKSKTALSDMQLALGWNFINCPKTHSGFAIRASLPFGNAPKGKYLFEPIVGNSGHYELGLGFTSHVRLWECDENDQAVTLYFDINGTHLFTNKQRRSFDFETNGVGSRYILGAQYQFINENPNNPNPPGTVTNPGTLTEYAGQLLPAINFATLCADVSIKFQADAVLKLAYTYNQFEFDLGYNFWGRTAERVTITENISEYDFSLKGDAFMYGAASTAIPNNEAAAQAAYAANEPFSRVTLSAQEEGTSTLFAGSNYTNTLGIAPELNPNVDNHETAFTGPGAVALVYSPIAGVGDDSTGIETSIPVNFITETSKFDVLSATAPSASTHKLFINSSYNFDYTACCGREFRGFISLGLEAEFDAKRKDLGCTSCECPAALNQWGVW